MTISRRKLKKIIKEAADVDAPATTPEEAKKLGSARGGRPDIVITTLKDWQSQGVDPSLVLSYLAAYKDEQVKMDFYYDDVPGYYPGKVADDIAANLGIDLKQGVGMSEGRRMRISKAQLKRIIR